MMKGLKISIILLVCILALQTVLAQEIDNSNQDISISKQSILNEEEISTEASENTQSENNDNVKITEEQNEQEDTNHEEQEHEEEEHEGSEHEESESASKLGFDDPEFYFYFFMAVLLVCLAGLCSGLTVGLTSIDKLALEIKMNNGTQADIEAGNAILPILADHHILLSTLLISNAICMEALPIFLDAIVPAYMAVIISTVAVVVVGEIVPQAYCTGPKQLQIAQQMAPLVKFLIKVLKPFTYFIAKGLDYILGVHHDDNYDQDQIKVMVSLYESMIPKCLNCALIVEKQFSQHGNNFKCRKCEHDKVNEQNYFICKNNCYGQTICEICYDSAAYLYSTEITAIKGVLDKIETKEQKEKQGREFVENDLSEKKGFVPIDKVVIVEENDKINKKSLEKIKKKCFSSLFVKNRYLGTISGIIKIKNIIQFFDQDTNVDFKSRMYSNLNFVPQNINYLDLINSFKEVSSDVAIVYEQESNILDENQRKKQQAQKFQEEINQQYNVENYSSLVPTNQFLAQKPQKHQVLEYQGKKILGIYTLKDIFEDMIDIDFGESQQDDKVLQDRFQEEIQDNKNNMAAGYSKNRGGIADSTTSSILNLMRKDSNKPYNQVLNKAASKFKGQLQKIREQKKSEKDVPMPEIVNKKRSNTQQKRF